MGKHSLEKENKVLRNIIKIVIYFFVVILVIYNISVIVQKVINPNEYASFLGYKNFIILSGSMEPELSIGDIILVKKSEKIEEGDIITFRQNSGVITHRVIEKIIEDGEIKYRTRGDANNIEDKEIVEKRNIEGKVCFKIPKIGNIFVFLQTKVGLILIVVILLLVFIKINKHETKKKGVRENK